MLYYGFFLSSHSMNVCYYSMLKQYPFLHMFSFLLTHKINKILIISLVIILIFVFYSLNRRAFNSSNKSGKHCMKNVEQSFSIFFPLPKSCIYESGTMNANEWRCVTHLFLLRNGVTFTFRF